MSQTATVDGATTTPVVESSSRNIKTVELTVNSPVKVKYKGGAKASTEAKVREYFQDIPVLAEVARCESTFRQFDEQGDTLRGIVNKSDLGVMQVNAYYHEATANKFGLDLHTLEGNMAYARKLYEREGVQPWSASQPCWGAHAAEIASR